MNRLIAGDELGITETYQKKYYATAVASNRFKLTYLSSPSSYAAAGTSDPSKFVYLSPAINRFFDNFYDEIKKKNESNIETKQLESTIYESKKTERIDRN